MIRQRIGRRLRRSYSQQSGFHLFHILADIVSMIPIGLDDTAQDLGKSRQVVAGRRREIRPPVKRFLVRRQKHRQGPPAAPSQKHLRGLLVDIVQVRALFSIDLHVNEVLVHEPSNFEIFEKFMCHDMAPVAGRVADRQQNRLVLCFRPRQGFLAPGIPLHWILRMLPEIGAGFCDKPVRKTVRLCGWICHRLFILTIIHTTLTRSRSATNLSGYVIVLRHLERLTA